MSGDYSRNSFDLAKHFSLVRLQQGRLLSDADFNEQGDLLRHDQRATASAIIGRSGFPQSDAGFALAFNAALGGFVVGTGSGYVDGRRVVCHGTRSLTVKHKSGSGVDARWIVEAGPALRIGDVLTITQNGSGPVHRVTGSETNAAGEAEFKLEPALTPQTTTQAWLVDVVDPRLTALPTAAGRYLAFLDTWDAAVTAIDDPDLLEVAFDGPDTATRDATRWAIGFVSDANLVARGLASVPLTCADVEGGINLASGRARLAARATVSAGESGPCVLPPDSGYRSVENHLYRVEIHTAPGLSAPHYKWSRDNGMHRTRYALIEDGALVVDSLGRDEAKALKAGDWIEIRDDRAIETNRSGFFARIGDVSGGRLILAELRGAADLTLMTVSGGLPNIAALPPSATIQRWEGGLPVVANPLADWVELELGVEIRLQPGAMLAGDYWTIPARALTGDVEWPANRLTGAPLDLAPDGLNRAYAPLAIVECNGAGVWTILSDCRRIFAPLTDQVQFDYVSGDGQEAMPDETAPASRIALGQPLMVSVTRGKRPVAGARVRFSVTTGTGRLSGNVASLVADTDAAGIASTVWSVDAITELQTVAAIRIDADDNPIGTKVEFAANLSRARDTSFDPSATPELAGALTVQDAIEQLAKIQHGGCETHVITPANDWIKVLAAIPAGSDASICFAPGRYTTEKTVKLTGLRHVKINGSGAGVEIIATKSECALEVDGCVSLLMRGLSFASVALRAEIAEKSQADHRFGALTVTGIAVVDIADCLFACAPDIETRHTALTVRARPTDTANAISVPMRSARIVNCRCSVGFLQEGILVSDAVDTIVADNIIEVAPLRPDFNTSGDKLSSKKRDELLGLLIARLTSDDAVLGDDIRELRAGNFSYMFMSAVPQSEWNRLVKKNPPPTEAETDIDALNTYAQKLIADVIETPSSLPSFDAGLKALGSGNSAAVDPDRRRQMLILREIGAKERKKSLREGLNVLIERDGQTVAFNSPVGNTEWGRIMTAAEEASPFKKDMSLSDYVLGAASQLLEGTIARTNFRDFTKWLLANTKRPPAMAVQAIVCAGRRLDSVRVSGNIIRGFNTAIRVAISHEKQSFTTGDAIIEDNLCELMTPGKDIKWLHAIYVGNVDRLSVRNNRLLHMKTPNHHKTRFEFGIWVYGFLGRQMLFKENHIEIARIGFRIKKLVVPAPPMPKDEKQHYLWLLADNLLVEAHYLDLISPDGIAKRRDNVI